MRIEIKIGISKLLVIIEYGRMGDGQVFSIKYQEVNNYGLEGGWRCVVQDVRRK